MATTQTSYAARVARGRAGDVIQDGRQQIDAYVADENIGFGVAVKLGRDGTLAKLGTAGSATAMTNYIGIALRDRTRPPDDGEYKTGANMNVMTKGRVIVQVNGAVAVGDDVTVTDATGELGTAAGSATVTPLARARWLTAAADNGLAVLDLDTFPVGGVTAD